MILNDENTDVMTGNHNQSINQSINHLFVLSSTRKQVDAQYSVEQDTEA